MTRGSIDASAVSGYKRVRDRQAETGAPVARARVEPVEAVEDAIQVFAGMPSPCLRRQHPFVLVADARRTCPPRGVCLSALSEQDQANLLETIRVAVDHRRRPRR